MVPVSARIGNSLFTFHFSTEVEGKVEKIAKQKSQLREEGWTKWYYFSNLGAHIWELNISNYTTPNLVFFGYAIEEFGY